MKYEELNFLFHGYEIEGISSFGDTKKNMGAVSKFVPIPLREILK
jgi:hypothetical protein